MLLVKLLGLGVFLLGAQSTFAYTGKQNNKDTPYNDWLKKEFSAQHQELIPVVAVADIYYSCNEARKVDAVTSSINELVLKLDRNTLALKLTNCLGDDTVKSDIAINFGLKACFKAQLAHLEQKDQVAKMALVDKAILSLSRSERQQSFTQCVTDQAIQYLQ